MENNKDIDDLFKDIVELNEMDHSVNVWTSLENHLDKKSNERNKGIIFRLRIAVGILLFLFGSFAVYYILSPKASITKSLVVKEQDKQQNSALLPEIKENRPNPKLNARKTLLNQEKKPNQIASENVLKSKKEIINTNLKENNFAFKNTKSSTKILQESITVSKNTNLSNDVQNNTLLANNEKAHKTMLKDSLTKNKSVENPIVSRVTDTILISEKQDSAKMILSVNEVASVFSKETLDSIQKNQFKNRISVVAYFSPDITMKYLKDNDNTDNQNEGDYNNSEVPDFSYNTGLLIGYDLSKNWTVKFGGSYAYLAQTIKPKVVYAQTGSDGLAHYQFNTTYGTSELPRDQTPVPIIGDSININTNSIQSLQVLGIPLIAKYQINRKKFSYYAQGGVSLNFIMSEKLIVETQNKVETIKNIVGLNEYYFGGILGLGVSYNPTQRFSILFEPTLKGAITPINKKTPITTRPFSFGLALGLGWHF